MSESLLPSTFCFESFEHYVLADTWREIPMGDAYRFSFTGQIDRQVFEKAIVSTIERHPLLQAKMVGSKLNRTKGISWKFLDNFEMPYLSFGGLEDPLEIPEGKDRTINLCDEVGVRFFVRADENQAVLTLQIHHSVCDAGGVMAIMEDLFWFYESELTGAPDLLKNHLPKRNPELLVKRGTFRRPAIGRIRTFFYRTFRHCLFFSFIPDGILLRGTRQKNQSDSVHFPAALSHEIDAVNLSSLKSYGKEHGASLNDMFICYLFRAADVWNKTISGKLKAGKIRVSMAVNMRKAGDEQLPACNIVSLVFLDRYMGRYQQPLKLLRSVSRETSFIKNHFLGMATISLLRIAGVVPGIIGHLTAPRFPYRSLSTCILSNVGKPFVGSDLPMDGGKVCLTGLCLDKIEAMPAGRPYLPIGFTLIQYANKMNLTMSFDPRKLSEVDAKTFLRAYVGDMMSCLGRGEEKSSIPEKTRQKDHALTI